MSNDPVFNAVRYMNNLSVSVDNIQKMHGTLVELWRIDNREENKFVTAYGTEKTNVKSEKQLKKIKDFKMLSTPQELYSRFVIGDGNEKILLYTKEATLLQGDIIRYKWTEEQVVEFVVSELPKNFGGAYFSYRVKSLYQIGNGKSE